MGDSIEQWRATIGQWSGGRPGQCVTLQICVAEISNHVGYRQIRFLLLVSLLVIGCVELNPGPDHETPAPSQGVGPSPKFLRRPGSVGLHGELYGVKTAAFLFAVALNRTEEFRLASNMAGAGAFDDLVFRYRLKEADICKTCFIQLKHKEKGGTIQRSSLTQMSGDFSLFKYFQSYCLIKASADRNIKQCGPFVDYEFVMYTNATMESNSALQGGDSDPVSILSSGTNCGNYITFDEKFDTDIFEFFKELSLLLEYLINREKLTPKQIEEYTKNLQLMFTIKGIKDRLDGLQSNPSNVDKLVKELQNCDFSLYGEFLGKVKIFQCQSNEGSFDKLIKKELQEACQSSPSCADSIYRKFYEVLRQWWGKSGSVKWLSENSHVWQSAKQSLIGEIAEPEIEKIRRCDLRFNQQHIKVLSDAIQQNNLLNIITSTKSSILSKLKTYQTLLSLNYKNSIFINSKTLLNRHKEIFKLWPCKWSATLIIDCEQQSDSVDESVIDNLVDFLRRYKKNVILIIISPPQQETLASRLRQKFGNVCTDYEDNCCISDLNAKSQNKILKRTVNFQGKEVPLETLVGTDPPECIKRLVDSDVISILLSDEHKLRVGRQLGDQCKYYVPRVLQRNIYLKEDILKLTDNATTFAVSGLQADQLKRYLPAGEKICEFVYDENKGSHSFKTVADFSKPGLSAELETKKTQHNEGQKMKYHNVKCVTLSNKHPERDFSDSINDIPPRSFDNSAKSDLSTELENMEACNRKGQKIKLEEVRYIFLGNKNPENKFRELKELYTNLHWIHMEEGSLLWKESNCNTDIIRRYIDNTKCREYDIESVMEHNDRTMLLVAEPGMGKSTFLSHMEHEIKKRSPAVWVLRINLSEHTRALDEADFKKECTEKCKKFLWNASRSPDQDGFKLVEEIFKQALEQTGKMVIILDGFDEISPDYTEKVNILIKEIRDKTASQILVSSRFSYRQKLEDILMKIAFTLQPFTLQNQIQFLEKYWKEIYKIYEQGNLRKFATDLLTLCSQNFSDKDENLTGIPLQTMMLGEAFINEAVENCSNVEVILPKKFNLLDLFNKFWEKKCNIYFSEKNSMDISKPEVKRRKEYYLEKHMISALISLFSQNELKDLCGTWDFEQAKKSLQNDRLEQFGILREITDGKPHFIHRYFAEYFVAKWFTDNFTKCENFIANNLFKTTYEVTRNIFDRMLAEDSEIHGAVLNNNIDSIKKFLKQGTDINKTDKGGRTALHLAASYNSPCTQRLLSFPGVDANKPDAVLKWTPLRYAEGTKSWMAMDILLQNGANTDDIVLIRRNGQAQEWGKTALRDSVSKGYTKLLEFMLNCGTDVNAILEYPENIPGKSTLLHVASICGQVEVVKFLIERNADINSRNDKNETALHIAANSGSYITEISSDINIRDADRNNALHNTAISGSVEIIKILLDKGMSVDLRNGKDSTPLHFSAKNGNLEATKTFVERGAALNNPNEYGATPLLMAAYKGKTEVFRYLTEKGADINIPDADRNTALHHAGVSGSVEIIKILLDKGMSVDLRNAKDSTPLHFSARNGNLEATKTFVERGAALNNPNEYGATPLLMAANSGKTEVFRYLTEKDADINFPDADRDTAFHHAAISGSVEIIKILLDKGMSVDLRNAEGSTPLHLSAACGNLEATRTLVERGAALSKCNKNGNTPLRLAAINGREEILHFLRGMCADINNQESHSPSYRCTLL